MEHFQHQQSVWSLIREHVPDSELPEIRALLGDALIDMYTEIHSEVEMWEQIWWEAQRSGQDNRPKVSHSPLADPPAIKELLRAEIQLLLLAVKEKAAQVGRDGDVFMSRYSPAVVNYALSSGGTERQGSADNSCETEKIPCLKQSGSRPSSRMSVGSNFEDDIEALKHKLNVSHIDEAVSHLKSVLNEECEALKKEVQFLQECVESEHQTLMVQEPTLAELKEERALIQRDLKRQSWTNGVSPIDQACHRDSQSSPREKRNTESLVNNSEKHSRLTPLVVNRSCSPPTGPSPPLSEACPTGSTSGRTRQRCIHCTNGPLPSPLSHHDGQRDCTSTYACFSHRKARTPTPEGPIARKSSPGSSVTNQSSPGSSPGVVCMAKGGQGKHSIDSGREKGFRLEENKGQVCGFFGEPSRSSQLRLQTGGVGRNELINRLEHGILLPKPPATQRPASRGQNVNRRLCTAAHEEIIQLPVQ